MILFLNLLLLINLYFIINLYTIVKNVYKIVKTGTLLNRKSFYNNRRSIMSDSMNKEKNKDYTIISREYLNYSGKGSEKEAINAINRDYNMDKFLRQVRQYSI